MASRKRKPPPACTACRAPVLFARVTGRQGRPVTIPLDPQPAAGGTVAAHRSVSGSLTGRFLARGEVPYGYERTFRQHRCPKPAAGEQPQNCGPAPAPAQPGLFGEVPGG